MGAFSRHHQERSQERRGTALPQTQHLAIHSAWVWKDSVFLESGLQVAMLLSRAFKLKEIFLPKRKSVYLLFWTSLSSYQKLKAGVDLDGIPEQWGSHPAPILSIKSCPCFHRRPSRREPSSLTTPPTLARTILTSRSDSNATHHNSLQVFMSMPVLSQKAITTLRASPLFHLIKDVVIKWNA